MKTTEWINIRVMFGLGKFEKKKKWEKENGEKK